MNSPGQQDPQKSADQRRGRGKGTRADGPPGMARGSLYVSQDALDSFTTAVDEVAAALGDDVPRHVAVSALLQAGADQVDEVAKQLTSQRAAELTERLAQLQNRAGTPPNSTD